MKKILYGTTALVTGVALISAPAAAEEGIKLGLGGYMNNFFGFGDTDGEEDNARAAALGVDDDVDRNATGLFSDGEIWFKGETTLDNGITFGANVQLESFGTSGRGGTGDVIDEDFAYISGSFGRFNIGSENSAAYLMHYASPNVGAPINSGWLSTFVPAGDANTGGGGFRTPRVSTYLDWNNDENIITYFTPRFSGFQVGVTYAPTVSQSGDGANFPVQADNDTEFNNGFAAGVNFVESIQDIDVAVSGGYRRSEAPDAFDVVDIEDLEQYSVGANIGYAGFTVGGSYAQEDSSRTTDGNSWDVGGSYATGPWSVGVNYFTSEVEGAASDEDEVDAFKGGVSYAVGPGITASASVLYVDWEGGNDIDADGVMGIVGLKYNF